VPQAIERLRHPQSLIYSFEAYLTKLILFSSLPYLFSGGQLTAIYIKSSLGSSSLGISHCNI
jgi:hypothetical protein